MSALSARQSRGGAEAARRHGRVPGWRRHAWRGGAVLLAGIVVSAAGWWLDASGLAARWSAQAIDAFHREVAASGLAVRNVFVAGRSETERMQIMRALDVTTGQSILRFDPEAARRRLLALGWVKDAVVERRLPDTIVVELKEREPLALWQRDGRHLLIDRDGTVITQSHLGRFATLPVVIGDDAPEHAAELLQLLVRQPELFAQVEAATRVGGRRWDIHMKDGIAVSLPEQGATEAWDRLALLTRRQHLFERDIAVIDMRLPDRLVVRMTPAGAAQMRKSGKDT